MPATTHSTVPASGKIVPSIDLHELATTGIVWLQDNWLRIAVAVGAATAVVLLLLTLRSLGRRLCDAGERFQWKTIIGRVIVRTNLFFMVTLAAELVNGYADAPPALDKTIAFLFTIAATFQVAIWVRELILGAVDSRTAGDGHSHEALGSAIGLIRLLVTFVVFAIALVVVLDNLGVNVTGLVAGLGVGGIAIGLAAQGIFADLFAALAIIFDRPFRKGDSIGYDQSSGTVEEIGLKSTRIRSITGEELIISNKNLLDKQITNNTRRDRRRVKFALGLVYWTPVELACDVPRILKEIVEANGMEFIRCGFITFADSSLNFELEFDSPHSDFQSAYDARHLIGLEILKRFNADGIEFAYPTQTSFTAGPDGKMILPYPEPVPPAN